MRRPDRDFYSVRTETRDMIADPQTDARRVSLFDYCEDFHVVRRNRRPVRNVSETI